MNDDALNILLSQLQQLFAAMQANVAIALYIVLGLWIIQLINYSLHYRLNILGLIPRKPFGLIGIVFSPFLHGSFNHLFFNAIPLFVLLNFMLINGINHFIGISIVIIGIAGIATWLFGRRGIHVGASGVIMGYWGYLLFDAVRNPSVVTVILAILVMYYFGSLFFSLFPQEESVSWEGHVFGFLAGLITAYYSIT